MYKHLEQALCNFQLPVRYPIFSVVPEDAQIATAQKKDLDAIVKQLDVILSGGGEDIINLVKLPAGAKEEEVKLLSEKVSKWASAYSEKVRF